MDKISIIRSFKYSNELTNQISVYFSQIPPDLVLIVICCLIMSLFIVGILDIMKIVRISRKIRKFCKKLNFNKINDDSKKEYLLNCSKDCEVLSGATEEFCESIVDDRNVAPAKEFIDPNHILHINGLNVDLINFLPGIILSLGICGTFIGIIFALNNAQWGTDFAQRNALVAQLIGGAGVAFITSIVGISFSILFTIIKRTNLGSYEVSISVYQNILDRSFQRINSEFLLTDLVETQAQQQKSLDQIGESSEQQVEALQAFSTDLASTIEKSIKSAVEENLKPSLELYMTKLTECFEELRTRSESGTAELVNSFIEKVGVGMNEQITNLRAVASNALDAQEKALSMTDSITQNLKEIQESQKTLMESFQSNIESADEFVSKMKFIINQLSQISEQFLETSEKIENIPDAIAKEIEFQKEYQKVIGDQMKTIEMFSENYSGLKDELTEALQQYGTGIKTGLETCMSKFDSELQRGGGYIANWAQDIGSKVEEFTSVVANAKNTLENNVSQINKVMEQSIKGLNEFSQSLTSNTKSLFDEYISKLENSAASFDKTLKDNFVGFSDTLSKLTPSIDQCFNSLQNNCDQHITNTIPNLLDSSFDKLSNLFDKKISSQRETAKRRFPFFGGKQ